MRKFLYVCLVMILALACVAIAAQNPPASLPTAAASSPATTSAPAVGRFDFDVGVYFKTIAAVRDAWGGTVADKSKSAAAAGAIEKLAMKSDAPGYAVCQYVRYRLMAMDESTRSAAQDGFVSLLDFRSVAPEAVRRISDLNGEDREKCLALDGVLEKLLPVSIWGGVNGDIFARVNPSPLIIPVIDREVSLAIAKEFEQAGLPDLAWEAYVEAIYGSSVAGPRDAPIKDGSWFSQDTAGLWQLAAENAWRAGERRLACDYLAKSAIFGDDAQFEKVKAVVQKWQADQGGKPPEVSRQQRGKSITEIARLYAEINAHPRALEMIQTYKDSLDNPNELYEKYAAEWQTIVKKWRSISRELVIYGTAMPGDADPTAIGIPFPCSDDAIKAAKSAVPEILKGASSRPTSAPLGR